MPTTMPTISPGQLNRFQGPIPLHLNQQYVRQNTTRTGGLMFPPDIDYDGRKLRRTAMRKTVDYNATIIRALENRIWQRDYRDNECMQPDVLYSPYMLPPIGYENNYTNSVTTRFIKAASNKIRCPVFCQAWTPEGRRLITGTSSGEFTLWNGLTFNFETILQAHDSPVRAMVWSHNDGWMVTGDHGGFIKYWQSNMNNVKMFQAHREPVRGVSFSPSDNKFATCSDDGTVRIWDFFKYEEEHVLRGHGSDVKCVDWHPYKAFIASGSKDSQQPVKLWDPRAGKCLGTLYAHKSTVMDIKWNRNGNWLMTASRDHLLKLFDVRNFSTELQIFRGHKKEASVLAWHPHHEGLICSGGTDGSILFWHVGTDREVAAIEQAHDSIVWALAWHPVGHILCSGSNDHSSKYWSRNLPGDTMRDKYNLNVNPYGGLMSSEERNPDGYIPGMGPEDKVDPDTLLNQSIPGLENLINDEKVKQNRKIPYAKPIPKEFQAAWNDTRRVVDGAANVNHVPVHKDFLQKLLTYAPGVKHVYEISPDALFMFGKLLPVIPNTELEKAIKGGEDILMRFINSGRVLELNMLLPYPDHGNTLPPNAVYQDNRGPMFAGENNLKNVDTGSNELRQPSNNDQNSRNNQSTLPPFGHGGDFDMRIPPSSLIHHNASSTTGEIDFRASSDFKTPYRPTVGVDSRISPSTPQSLHQPLAPPLPPPTIPSLLNRPPSSARPVIQFNTNRFSSSAKSHPPSPSHSNSVTNNNSNSNDNFSRSRFPPSGSQFNNSSNTASGNSNTNKQQYWSSNFEQHHNEISMGYDTNASDDNDNYPDDDYPESWNNDPPQDDDDYGTMDTDNYDDDDYRYSGSQRSFHEKSSSSSNYWNDRNRSSSSWNNNRAPPPRWGNRDRGNSGRGFRGNRAGGSSSGGSGGFGGSGGRIPSSSNRGTASGSGMTRGGGFRGRGDFPRRSDNKRYPSSNFRSK